jgi:hypothetical protein
MSSPKQRTVCFLVPSLTYSSVDQNTLDDDEDFDLQHSQVSESRDDTRPGPDQLPTTWLEMQDFGGQFVVSAARFQTCSGGAEFPDRPNEVAIQNPAHRRSVQLPSMPILIFPQCCTGSVHLKYGSRVCTLTAKIYRSLNQHSVRAAVQIVARKGKFTESEDCGEPKDPSISLGQIMSNQDFIGRQRILLKPASAPYQEPLRPSGQQTNERAYLS